MDPGWDHTENEDKLLLTHTSRMNMDMGQDMYGSDNVSRGGCNVGNMGSGDRLISLNNEYGKHLSSVVLNNVNRMHIFLYDLIPTNLSYFCNIVSNILSLIKFCRYKLRKAINIINCIIILICKCNTDIIKCFQKFLKQIRCNLQKLYLELHKLHCFYLYINCLKNQLQKTIKCSIDVSSPNSNMCRLIKAFNCSLWEFPKIESLLISAKSIVYELKESKNQLMVLNNSIPSEESNSVYFKIKCCCDMIDKISSAIEDFEFYTWCLKYWIYKFINVSNANHNSLSTLAVSYIPYFYHVFPLHLNTFNKLFSDVINPKLVNLKSCIDDLMICFNEIYNIQSQFKYIFNFYYQTITYFQGIPLNQFFIQILNLPTLLEPYIKILTDALDHDVDVLTNLYNYYNLIQVYFNYLFDNIKNFYLNHLNKLLFDKLYEITDYDFKPKFRDELIYIKSYIYKFYPYRNRNIYYVLNNIKTIKRIKDETLTKLRDELKQIKLNQPNYINNIKNKLEDHYSDDFHSYHLNNIQDLAPIISAPTNLNDLRVTLIEIKNNFVYSKKKLSESVSVFVELIKYKFFKWYAQSKYSSETGFSSIIKWIDNEIKTKEKTSEFKFYRQILDTYKNMNYLIDEINLIIEYIPNVIPKLKKAKSKLDKKTYAEHLLDLLKLENIDNIRGITLFINENRKNIRTDILKKITLNRRIIIELFIFKNIINNQNPIELIKSSINQKLSIINTLKSIDKHIIELKGINSELNTNNVYVKITNIKLRIKEIEKVLDEIDFNMVSEIEEMIDLLEHVKNSIIRRRLNEYLDFVKFNLVNLYNIIGILNLIKSLIERLKCFKQKLENKLGCYKSKINELECAIEGVARNFIQCTIKSLTANSISINRASNSRIVKDNVKKCNLNKIM